MLGFLPTRAYRPGTPGATTFLSPLSGTFNYGWDSFVHRWGLPLLRRLRLPEVPGHSAAASDELRLGEHARGGMATVYLADDLKHQRKVALKVLKPELAGGDVLTPGTGVK